MKGANMNEKTQTNSIDNVPMDRLIDAMMGWGYGVNLSYNSKHYGTLWSVHITYIAKDDSEEPVSQFFGGPTPETAVGLAYDMVSRWQNAKQHPQPDLSYAFATLINERSLESESNTPDWILGDFLRAALESLDEAIQRRDKWYGVTLEPGRTQCLQWSELWNSANEAVLRAGAEIVLGKRRWRLTRLPKKLQGDDLWNFECTDGDGGIGCDRHHNFTRSELQWLVCHGALKYNPEDGEGAAL